MREDPTTQYQIIEEGPVNMKDKTKVHSKNPTVQLRRVWYLEFGKVYRFQEVMGWGFFIYIFKIL